MVGASGIKADWPFGGVCGAVANFLTPAFYVVKRLAVVYDPSYLNIGIRGSGRSWS